MVAVVLALRAVTHHSAAPALEAPDAQPGTVRVRDGVYDQPVGAVAVRGFVFDGGGTGPRLCDRKKLSEPPSCKGPFLDLHGFDPASLPMRHGVSLKQRVEWVDRPVTLYGTIDGTAMSVTQVAQ